MEGCRFIEAAKPAGRQGCDGQGVGAHAGAVYGDQGVKRVVVVITARPSYSRIKSALVALQARHDVKLQIVAAASALVTRYGCIVDQIRADGFDVVAEMPCVLEGSQTRESAISTGLLTAQLASTFDRLQPDMVVTIADRHETLATAIAASYQHIPLCHIQGGEVSGSIDDKVRNAVTQLADIHCGCHEGSGPDRGRYALSGCSCRERRQRVSDVFPHQDHRSARHRLPLH